MYLFRIWLAWYRCRRLEGDPYVLAVWRSRPPLPPALDAPVATPRCLWHPMDRRRWFAQGDVWLLMWDRYRDWWNGPRLE